MMVRCKCTQRASIKTNTKMRKYCINQFIPENEDRHARRTLRCKLIKQRGSIKTETIMKKYFINQFI